MIQCQKNNYYLFLNNDKKRDVNGYNVRESGTFFAGICVLFLLLIDYE